LALKETYEREDEIEDAAEDAEEAQHEREVAAAQALKKPKPLDEGGGLYFYERVYWGARDLFGKIFKAPTPSTGKAPAP
jgi:hypothetical protein